ncbi:MAG TPA: choice-of-anchor tandem repeat GloVer-containing protein [Rhizomicrobium sp.]|nr:choice-of-anchor tandem repeat GloVer-containing protein [Rhizomicrobium sp.]
MRKARSNRFGAALSAAVIAALCLAMPAAAGSVKTLHAFSDCSGGKCHDGSAPAGNLVRDSSGNLYGTTSQGGKHGAGTIFQLSPDGKGSWRQSTIYSFCSEDDCADGATPQSTLIIDANGSLYGIAQAGGEDEGAGVGFKLERGADGWELIVIHNFCGADAPEDDCMGGATPAGGFTYAGAAAGLPYDGESPLYGASTEGGEGEAGIIYQLKPRKDNAREKDKEEWRISELYVFCAPDGVAARRYAPNRAGIHEEGGNCDDGKMPSGSLLVDGRGNLYGTTYFGGEDANYEGGGGVVFELARDPVTKTWNESVLYKFCSVASCRDGRAPHGGLISDATGNLYGATQFGGHNCNNGQFNCGAVFMVSPNGEHSVSRVLHAFCSAADCADGATPQGALAMDETGNLFGATLNRGKNKGGVVYKLQPDGKLQVLHSFCGTKECSGGRYPNGVILDLKGQLFGVATAGGKKNGGLIFQLQD